MLSSGVYGEQIVSANLPIECLTSVHMHFPDCPTSQKCRRVLYHLKHSNEEAELVQSAFYRAIVSDV